MATQKNGLGVRDEVNSWRQPFRFVGKFGLFGLKATAFGVVFALGAQEQFGPPGQTLVLPIDQREDGTGDRNPFSSAEAAEAYVADFVTENGINLDQAANQLLPHDPIDGSERERENRPSLDEALEASVGAGAYVVDNDEVDINRFGDISFSGDILAEGQHSDGSSTQRDLDWTLSRDAAGSVTVATAYTVGLVSYQGDAEVEYVEDATEGVEAMYAADRIHLGDGNSYPEWGEYFGSPVPVENNDGPFGFEAHIPPSNLDQAVDSRRVDSDNRWEYYTEATPTVGYLVIPASVADGVVYPRIYVPIKVAAGSGAEYGPGANEVDDLKLSNGEWNPTAYIRWEGILPGAFDMNNEPRITTWLFGQDAGRRAESSNAEVRRTANDYSFDELARDWFANNATRQIVVPNGLLTRDVPPNPNATPAQVNRPYGIRIDPVDTPRADRKPLDPSAPRNSWSNAIKVVGEPLGRPASLTRGIER